MSTLQCIKAPVTLCQRKVICEKLGFCLWSQKCRVRQWLISGVLYTITRYGTAGFAYKMSILYPGEIYLLYRELCMLYKLERWFCRQFRLNGRSDDRQPGHHICLKPLRSLQVSYHNPSLYLLHTKTQIRSHWRSVSVTLQAKYHKNELYVVSAMQNWGKMAENLKVDEDGFSRRLKRFYEVWEVHVFPSIFIISALTWSTFK